MLYRKNTSGAGQAGLGMPEVMVSILVLVGVGLIVSSAINNVSVTSEQSASGSSCRAYVQNVLEATKAEQATADVANFYPVFSGGAFDLPPAMTGGISRRPAGLSWLPETAGSVTAQMMHPWAMANTSVNIMWSLYNQYDFCTNPVMVASFRPHQTVSVLSPAGQAFVSSGLIPPLSSLNWDSDIFIRLQRFNMSTGAVDCGAQGSLMIPPKGRASLSTYYGIRLTVTGRIRPATTSDVGNATWQSCQATTTLTHNADFSPPSLLSAAGTSLDPLMPSGGCSSSNVSGTDSGFCSNPSIPLQVFKPCTGDTGQAPWNNTANCGNNQELISRARTYAMVCANNPPTLNWIFRTNERGAAFMCEMSHAPVGSTPALSGTWSNCSDFSIENLPSSPQVRSVQRALASESFNGLRLSAVGLPFGDYHFRTRAVDGAQNASPTVDLQFRVENRCPTSWTNAFCPSTTPVGVRSAPYPDQCGNTGMCEGTMPVTCLDPNTVTCQQPLLDVCGRNCGVGRRLSHAQCATNRSSVQCQDAVYDNCGNLCPPEYRGTAPNPALAVDTSCDQQRRDPCGHPHGPGSQPPSSCPGPCSATCGQPRPVPPGCPAGSCGTGQGPLGPYLYDAGLISGAPICDSCGNTVGEGTCVEPLPPAPPIGCNPSGGPCGPPPDCSPPPTSTATCDCSGAGACPTRAGYVIETWCTGTNATNMVQTLASAICSGVTSGSACDAFSGADRNNCISTWQNDCNNNAGGEILNTLTFLVSLINSGGSVPSNLMDQARDMVTLAAQVGGQDVVTRLNLAAGNSATNVTARAGGATGCIDSSATSPGQLKQGGVVVGACSCPCNGNLTTFTFTTPTNASVPMPEPSGMNSGVSLPSCPYGGEPAYTACQ